MKRIVVYIDGQNIYQALKEVFDHDGYAFNYKHMVESLVQSQTELKGPDSVVIKYYGAVYPAKLNESKAERDDAFFQHLERDQGITVVRGNFKIQMWNGIKVPIEKGVDVRIATDLIFDCVYQSCDIAILFSNDTDLIPAINQIKLKFQNHKTFHYSVGRRRPAEYQKACYRSFKVYDQLVKRCCKYAGFKADDKALARLEESFKTGNNYKFTSPLKNNDKKK